MTRFPLLILAGGGGKRLAGLRLGVPKPLAPIRGVPFLFLLLRHLRVCGFRSVLIAVNRDNTMIQDQVKTGRTFGVRVRYHVIPKRPYGTGTTVLQVRKRLTNDFYVLNGDTYVSFNPRELESVHAKQVKSVTLAMVPKPNVSRFGSLRVTPEQRIGDFVEKGKSGPGLVSAGVLLVNQAALRSFREDKDYSLEQDILPRLARVGSLYGHRVRGNFWDIGTPRSYRAFLHSKASVQ